MAGRNFLFVPGPTNVPDQVPRAMALAMQDHRSSAFAELTFSLLTALKKRVVFLDRASLRARVRKPSCASE